MLKNKIGVLITCLGLLMSVPAFSHDEEGDKEDGEKNRTRIMNTFPDVIPVPDGFQPEGVITGRGHTAYVGSMLNGAIYQINLKTGDGQIVVEGAPGKATVGMAYDKRSNHIYAAGGIFGNIIVYDADDGSELKSYQVGSAGGFINDGIVTEDAVYFTDSFVPVLYKIPLDDEGELADDSEVETIQLSGEFENIDGEFNANGIEASKDGDQLYVINMTEGKLFSVDPTTGEATTVDLGGALLGNGDGLLLRGKTMYVVQNFINQITEIRLFDDGLSGTVNRVITDPNFQIPTTASYFGKSLYVINARFDVAPPPLPGSPPADPNTTFDLIRVSLH